MRIRKRDRMFAEGAFTSSENDLSDVPFTVNEVEAAAIEKLKCGKVVGLVQSI